MLKIRNLITHNFLQMIFSLKFILFLSVLVSAQTGLIVMVKAEEPKFSQFIWENRLILVFSPSLEDTRLISQINILKQKPCGIRNRDIFILNIINGQGVTALNGLSLSFNEKKLRIKYHLQYHEFMVILVGKDGWEKNRWKDPVSADSIFNEIDAMPMRQNERALDYTNCS